MSEATPPIVIIEGRDIRVYQSIAEASLELEAIDVIDGVYQAFDANGRRLRLVTNGILVSIEVPQDSPLEPVELVTQLRRYIQEVGVDHVGIEHVDDASLLEMLQALIRFQHDDLSKAWTRSFASWVASVFRRRS